MTALCGGVWNLGCLFVFGPVVLVATLIETCWKHRKKGTRR